MQCRENHARSYVCLKGREEKGYYGWASECLEYGMGQYMLCPRINKDPRTTDISRLGLHECQDWVDTYRVGKGDLHSGICQRKNRMLKHT